MTANWKRNARGKLALLVSLALACGACTTTPTQPQPIAHVVLLWLQNPGSTAERNRLIRAANSLRMMTGVTQVEAGRTAPMPPPGTDLSYDLAVVVTFRDRAALQRFEGDPRHAGAMQRYLRPLVRRYLVYDLGDR